MTKMVIWAPSSVRWSSQSNSNSKIQKVTFYKKCVAGKNTCNTQSLKLNLAQICTHAQEEKGLDKFIRD